MEQRTGQGPADDDGACKDEGLRPPGGTGRPISEPNEISLVLHELSQAALLGVHDAPVSCGWLRPVDDRVWLNFV
jgi:hypothetical protein